MKTTNDKNNRKHYTGGSFCTSNPTFKRYAKPIAIMSSFHIFIALSINHFLPLSATGQVTTVFLLISLSGIFPYSYIKLRQAATPFIQGMYQISAFWLGTTINLTLAAALNWTLEVPRIILDLQIPNPSFFVGTMALSMVYSMYGVWNAFTPRLKTHTATIEGLPQYWHDKKIVHLSDLHLGYVFGERHLQKAVDQILLIGPHMTAITGDLADSIQKDIPQQVAPLARLAKDAPVFFTPGNHDPDHIFPHLEKAGITVLDDRAMHIEGLQIAGSSCEPRNSKPRHIETSIKGYRRGIPTILLKHIPSHIESSKNSGVHLQLSGHTHGGQQFPFGLIARRIYKRFTHGFHTLEKFSINVSTGLGTWGPPMRTATNSEITVIILKGNNT